MTWWSEPEDQDWEDPNYKRRWDFYEWFSARYFEEIEFNREKLREHGYRAGVPY